MTMSTTASRLSSPFWLALVIAACLHAATAAPLLPTGGFPAKRTSPRTAEPLSECEAALSRKMVVIFAGPEEPYLGSLPNFMPNHGIDVDPEDTSLLALSDPEQASCASSIRRVQDTLVIFEDGGLPQYEASLPSGIVSTSGSIVVYGKPGRVGKGISSLSFLSKLKSVRGLSVYDLDATKDLKGLENLERVTGDLIISENMMLRSMVGLENLKSVGGDLIMNSNMNLLTVDGLQALESIGGQIILKGNGQLRTLDALTSLQSVGMSATLINNGNHNMKLPRGVAVGPEGGAQVAASRATEGPGGYDGAVLVIHGDAGPPLLDEVSGTAFMYMPPLQNFEITQQNVRFAPSGQAVKTNEGGVIRGHVVIWDDGTLQPMSSTLFHVTEVTGSFIYLGGVAIESNLDSNGLSDFWGLDKLRSVGALGIIGATQIKNLQGFKVLSSIKGSLTIGFCPRLENLYGLGPEGTRVEASSSSVLSTFMSVRNSGRKLAQRASSGLRKIGSEIWIASNPELRDLTGLEGLEEVGWRLSISQNIKLQSLAALGSLKSVGGGLVIIDNPSLSSTSGLASLEDVGLHAHILWNIGLKDVEGLSKLRSTKGDVAIVASPMVTDLSPLSGLQKVGMNLVLSRLGIKDMNGLGNLVSVGLVLDVSENWALSSLQGLNTLTQIGGALYLINNPVLGSLDPLTSTLRKVGGGVYLENNPSLSVPVQWASSFKPDMPVIAPAPPPSVPANILADSERAAQEHKSSNAIDNPIAPKDAAYGAVPGSLGGSTEA